MKVIRLWSTVNVIAGIAVASWILYESLPRNMLGGKNLDLSILGLCFSGLAFVVLHSRLSNKLWLLELCAFIVACPLAVTLAYLAYDYDRFTKLLKGLPNPAMFLFSPPIFIAALYGCIAGIVAILLERIAKRLRHDAPALPRAS